MIHTYTKNLPAIYNTLNKKREEYRLKLSLLDAVIAGASKVQHHKNVTKKLVTAIKEQAGNYPASLQQDYTQRVTVYLTQRTYNPKQYPAGYEQKPDHFDYFEDVSEVIYFKDIPELIENAKKRKVSIKEADKKLAEEINNLPALVKEVEAIAEAYNTLENKLSYTLREAINLK